MADGMLPQIGSASSDSQSKPSSRRAVQRNTLLNNPMGNLVQPSHESQSVDDKLNEQFRYFRTEYVEAAHSSGVAVPMMIVDDKSGQVYKFVLNGGPKYLFEVMQANLENIHLMRCSLSLLVMIITILRRKLPDPSAQRGFVSGHSVATTDSISAWVADALAKIGDGAAVSVCISVLISSYNPSVQELALSLLASMLNVSDEAVAHMMQPYSSSGAPPMDMPIVEKKNPRKDSGMMRTTSRPNSVESSHSQVSDAREEAEKPKIDFTKLNFSYNTMDYTTKKPKQKKQQKVERLNSCLSYVLSVILVQKNRHLLAAEMADVVLAMLRKNREDLCESIARTSTCELPALDDRKSKGESRNSLGKFTFNPQPEESVPPPATPTANIIEWAGLKLMLKFLFRYEKMGAPSSKAATRPIARDSVSASLCLKDEYTYAHSRVFTAVCHLIAGSPEVAMYTKTLPGAEDLLAYTSKHLSPDDVNGANSYAACAFALQQQQHKKEHAENQKAGMMLAEYLAQGKSGIFPPMATSPLGISRRTSGISRGPSHSLQRSSQASRAKKGSAPRTEVLNESIQLMGQHKMKFQGEYEVQTETGELYLLNSYDAQYKPESHSDLARQSQADKHFAKNKPLNYNPSGDKMLEYSLDEIGTTTLRPLMSQSPSPPRRTVSEPYQTDQSGTLHSRSVTTDVSSEYTRQQEIAANVASSLSFFANLPSQPGIPTRIEAKDVIVEREDLTRIRMKFREWADDVEKKAYGKKGLTAAEKTKTAISENLSSVYGPKKFMFVSENHEKHSARKPKKISGDGEGGEEGLDARMEQEMFGSFSDESGVPFQDRPFQPHMGGMGGGMEGMEFSIVDPPMSGPDTLQAGSTASEGPEVYGLRLENFDFDEQNLFDGFKPLFDYPTREPETRVEVSQQSLDELGVGRKSKASLQMSASIDLIL
ncbi:hypothetical protein B484DRAFT_455928 [Ochromonadaceae sp. CCMP2298]|nr:hypothetical protein B484DRAFT_455928 [Ochromonadaceae sp. CCMP2298]|mmetsp:Transcript_6372/g.14087  ORF Transcript_6372/g.14087 Transcript_6372/m.14087 type:complete len:937 (-) Transcript_6372:676-3486(-)|eukprot:CAMPEP_0173168672 /NCGR_PEP_ID=MMETSP1141-20130122/278_1 /TAXON_ID=483371 /ORGANISM="non described non described, Strain CCMP2298" /LENGTH=936 /DNA_ID=CAMNT_0014090413 /DNA_START=98 /DNA_END=2908 /DNA_ORIENTATION=-